MIEEDFCPYCDELVKFEFTDDYYETNEGDEAGRCICYNCNKEVIISWESTHTYHFTRKQETQK